MVKRKQDLYALYLWLQDWTETARAVVLRRDDLIRLGIGRRRRAARAPSDRRDGRQRAGKLRGLMTAASSREARGPVAGLARLLADRCRASLLSKIGLLRASDPYP